MGLIDQFYDFLPNKREITVLITEWQLDQTQTKEIYIFLNGSWGKTRLPSPSKQQDAVSLLYIFWHSFQICNKCYLILTMCQSETFCLQGVTDPKAKNLWLVCFCVSLYGNLHIMQINQMKLPVFLNKDICNKWNLLLFGLKIVYIYPNISHFFMATSIFASS